MKKLMVLLLSAIVLLGCTKVPPGYVGIVVNNYGSQKGVSDFPIKTGRVTFNPFTEDVYVFPTYQQNIVWSSKTGAHEGGDEDQSITVNSVEGATVNFDTQVSVTFIPDSVPKIFVKFRKDEDHIMQVYVRSLIRDAFSRHASRLKVTDIFGVGKQALQDSVLADVRKELTAQGIQLAQLSMIGEMRVDDRVKSSINAVLEATQKAIEAQNKVMQAKAEADQKIATSRGDSASAVIAAMGQAHANKILSESVTPTLIQYQTVIKWNGVLPTVTGSGIPMLNIKPEK